MEFLRENVDVFAWSAYEAPGIDPSFICHQLNVNPSIIPKRQPPRCPSKEHAEAVRSEVAKLKQAGAIKEVFYPQWLANTVVVKKKTGKWQVCINFTDLNISAQLWFEHFSHHSLVGRPCIFQSKGHHFIMIVSNGSDKSCLLLIVQC